MTTEKTTEDQMIESLRNRLQEMGEKCKKSMWDSFSNTRQFMTRVDCSGYIMYHTDESLKKRMRNMFPTVNFHTEHICDDTALGFQITPEYYGLKDKKFGYEDRAPFF